MILDAEFIECPRNPLRALHDLKELAKENKCHLIQTPTYSKKWLFLWGGGGEYQNMIAKKQRAAGGQVCFLDLGYWGRDKAKTASSFRISFNEFHPNKYLEIAYGREGNRFAREGISVVSLSRNKGHVLICGMGRKSRAFYGFDGMEWERKQVRRIREFMPEHKIYFRPKPHHYEAVEGCVDASSGNIREALNGAALCVVYHSNVALDCISAGIPCIASNGLGALFWPDKYILPVEVPNPKRRSEFLEACSWFNWYPREAKLLLEFIRDAESRIIEISKS